MIIIEFAEHGILNPDIKSESYAMRIYESYNDKNHDYLYTSSTESLFTAFRMLVAEGKIPHNEVVFKYNGEIMNIGLDGELIGGYPKGFCDAEIHLMHRIIKAKINKNKKNRE